LPSVESQSLSDSNLGEQHPSQIGLPAGGPPPCPFASDGARPHLPRKRLMFLSDMRGYGFCQ
jgi:hypothetical protein